MTLVTEIQQIRDRQFIVLILDNEVTVGEFVSEPPLPWNRIVQQQGVFQVAAGYPQRLTAAQAKFEMTNWDEVSLSGILETLGDLAMAVDYYVIGNNAGQGLPIAQAVTERGRASQAAIIYASSLPQQSAYEQMGYRDFLRRRDTTAFLIALAQAAGRPPALYFINTIQHNSLNYHDP